MRILEYELKRGEYGRIVRKKIKTIEKTAEKQGGFTI